MPNRYKTSREVAGAKRRTQAYQDKLRGAGLTPRQYWVSEAENAQLKRVVKRWRGEPADLSPAEAEAADILKPAHSDDAHDD